MKPNLTAALLFSCAIAISSQALHAQAITTFAGNTATGGPGAGGYSGNGGPAINAKFSNPSGVATYGFSNVYIADQNNHVVRVVDYRGIVSRFAGNDTAGSTGNGKAATAARLNTPRGIAADALGNIYIADYGAHVVRKVNTAGIISTVAGTGAAGYSGDGAAATAAKLYYPHSVAVDNSGNLFIADANNNVIRMVNAFGIISTFAGNGFGSGTGHGAYSGDGGSATAAALNFPAGVATDVFGNVYVADAGNNVVRKIDASRNITTVAGTGVSGFSGDGGTGTAARLNTPTGVATDVSGNVYIADQGNYSVRKLSVAGTITAFAGTNIAGYAGDGGFATAAQLDAPASIAVDGNGLVYIADHTNNVIRMVGGTAGIGNLTSKEQALSVFPNPSHGSFTVAVPQVAGTGTLTVTDMAGRTVATRTIAAGSRQASVTINNIPAGSYLVKLVSGEITYRQQMTIQ